MPTSRVRSDASTVVPAGTCRVAGRTGAERSTTPGRVGYVDCQPHWKATASTRNPGLASAVSVSLMRRVTATRTATIGGRATATTASTA